MNIYITTLFITAKTRKQPRCLAIGDEWANFDTSKQWSIIKWLTDTRYQDTKRHEHWLSILNTTVCMTFPKFLTISKELNPQYSLEGLMLKSKLQNPGHLMWRVDSLEKTLIMGKIKGKSRRGWKRLRWLESITVSMYVSLSKLWEMVKDREAWYAAVHGVTKNRIQISNWTISSNSIDGWLVKRK